MADDDEDDDVVSEEQARVSRAKSLLSTPGIEYRNSEAAPPSMAMLNAEAESQSPEGQEANKRAQQDAFIRAYVDPPQQAALPAGTAPAGTGGVGNTPAPIELPRTDPGAMGAQGAASSPTQEPGAVVDKVAAADAKAAERSTFDKLAADKQRLADAYFAAQNQQPRAVVVSRGGMRPDTQASQVTQGPEVKESDRLLHEIEYNAIRAAGDGATAELKRDTDTSTIAASNSDMLAKTLPAEHKAQQEKSSALGQVADRMQKALESAKTPVISPAQELASMGIGQKIAFALAASGGAMAGRANGTNPFLAGYNQMVDARISAQEREAKQNKDYAGGQQNLYAVMRQGFESDDAARAALRLMYGQALDAKMKEAAAHYNIDMANPNYQKQQSQISEQILKDQMELAKISGQHISQQSTSRYAPPQVAMVGGGRPGDRGGGLGKEEAAVREKIQKLATEGKWGEMASDMDSLNNIVKNADKGGLIAGYIASHPGQSAANAFIALMSDPTERQKMVDIEHSVKDAISGSGMRSELGRQLGQTLSNPTNAGEVYNRKAKIYQDEVSNALSSLGPGAFNIYRDMRGDAEAMRAATNTPIIAQGSRELPSALPEQGIPSVRERGAPIVEAYNSRKKSHHKKPN